MKKLLMMLVACMILVGCGSSNSSSTDTTVEEFTFESNGTKINMNVDVVPIVEALGGDVKPMEARSCAFDGYEYTYTYPGFKLTTYPKEDKNWVDTVVLQDDTVSTLEGVCIGDNKSKVIEAYGDQYEEKGIAYRYTKGKSILEFIYDDNSVSSIAYIAITD